MGVYMVVANKYLPWLVLEFPKGPMLDPKYLASCYKDTQTDP